MFACNRYRLFLLLLITCQVIAPPPPPPPPPAPPATPPTMPTTSITTPKTTTTTPIPHLKLVDKSCTHKDKNVYQFGYDLEEIKGVSLFTQTEGRFPSYVGYPCYVPLWTEFDKLFTKKRLSCPFKDNLDAEFQRFVQSKLWPYKQKNTNGGKLPDAGKKGNTLLFQYICFSNQFEECVFNPKIANLSGSCNGICQCRNNISVEDFSYPTGLTNATNFPKIKTEGIQCGVVAGGLCYPNWEHNCTNGTKGYNLTLERHYNSEDFLFKCEANAGCHQQKRVCECAQGYTCAGSRGWSANRIICLCVPLISFILSLSKCIWKMELEKPENRISEDQHGY